MTETLNNGESTRWQRHKTMERVHDDRDIKQWREYMMTETLNNEEST